MSLTLDLARSFLMRLEPERAHELTLLSLEQGFYPRALLPDDLRLAQRLWTLNFTNPFGVAAGFDKDGRVFEALLRAGFGFAEVGTVTPRAQSGNPPPRVFRLIEDRAIINRLGFNSQGHEPVLARLRTRKDEGIVGVNIGANADSADKVADFVAGIETFASVADYLVVNVSSPNTPGLRDLQAPEALEGMLARLMDARHKAVAAGSPRRPILVKLAPDIHDEDLPEVVERLSSAADGIVVSNTTLSRAGLRDKELAKEAGGLSGRPLFERSTRMLAKIHQLTQGRVPLIGVGGIDSGTRAVEKIRAGASLVQLYTGLVYEGPELLDRMKEAVLAAIESAGVSSVGELVGLDAQAWAARPPPA